MTIVTDATKTKTNKKIQKRPCNKPSQTKKYRHIHSHRYQPSQRSQTPVFKRNIKVNTNSQILICFTKH